MQLRYVNDSLTAFMQLRYVNDSLTAVASATTAAFGVRMPVLAVLLAALLLCVALPVAQHVRYQHHNTGKFVVFCAGAPAGAAAPPPAARAAGAGGCGYGAGGAPWVLAASKITALSPDSMALSLSFNTQGRLAADEEGAEGVQLAAQLGLPPPAGKNGWVAALGSGEALVLTVNYNSYTYKDGDLLPTLVVQATPVPTSTSAYYTNAYPFDEYRVPLSLALFILADGAGGGANATALTPVPIEWHFDLAFPQFSVRDADGAASRPPPPPRALASATRSGAATVLRAPLLVSRGGFPKFLSMWTVVLMWLLSSCSLVIALDAWASPRHTDVMDMTVTIGLLFALPSVRLMQPGIPPVGCYVDVIGFVWNISMTALAALLVMARFVNFTPFRPKAA
ncbi:MAG: hypothetical protein J3K34DRAFT_520427 [Monoraphidium minutum]|nr:MAG: hypothetical protein J3K34DRAFT_520427 [Monoraphidium minutum]